MAACGRITVTGMVFQACHGAWEGEHCYPQRFEVDVTILADLSKAASSDNLRDTVDYNRIYEITREVITGPPRNLLEHLAARIAERCLALPLVEAATVKIRKPSAPMSGPVSAVEVEISLIRDHAQSR